MGSAPAYARSMGFPPDRIEDLKTAVAEACINAVQHGNKGLTGARVIVTVSFSKGVLGIAVLIQVLAQTKRNNQTIGIHRAVGALQEGVSHGGDHQILSRPSVRRRSAESHVLIPTKSGLSFSASPIAQELYFFKKTSGPYLIVRPSKTLSGHALCHKATYISWNIIIFILLTNSRVISRSK